MAFDFVLFSCSFHFAMRIHVVNTHTEPCNDNENPKLKYRKKHNCFNISIHIAEPLASVLYSRMKRLYHTEVWYGRFLLYPLEGGESDVLIAVIIIVTTNHFFIHSMPSWHVAYIAENRAVKRYGFSLLWWHAPRREERLTKAFMELPLKRRQVMELLFLADLSEAETAKRLNCSLQYVRNQRCIALKKLRSRLMEGGDDE